MPNETIYIGFSSRKGCNPMCWIIKKFMGTPYSHVYVRIPAVSLQRDLIYEASSLTVHFNGGEQFLKKSKVIREYPLEISPETKIKIFQYAIDNLEKPYGIFQLIGFAWVVICKKFGKKVKNPFRNGPSAFVCSELVASIMKQADIDMMQDPDSITPKDIDEFLAKTKGANETP